MLPTSQSARGMDRNRKIALCIDSVRAESIGFKVFCERGRRRDRRACEQPDIALIGGIVGGIVALLLVVVAAKLTSVDWRSSCPWHKPG